MFFCRTIIILVEPSSSLWNFLRWKSALKGDFLLSALLLRAFEHFNINLCKKEWVLLDRCKRQTTVLSPLIKLWSMHFLKMKQYNYPQSTGTHHPHNPNGLKSTAKVRHQCQLSLQSKDFLEEPLRSTMGSLIVQETDYGILASMDHCHWPLTPNQNLSKIVITPPPHQQTQFGRDRQAYSTRPSNKWHNTWDIPLTLKHFVMDGNEPDKL